MTHNHDGAFFTTYVLFRPIWVRLAYYAKHARAFRSQIDLNKKNNADQFWYGKHGACFPYPPKQSLLFQLWAVS